MGWCPTRGSSRREEEMEERLGEGLLGRGGGWGVESPKAGWETWRPR